jgi:hypothetical protein
MAKQDKIPSYPCMMQPGDLRLVQHPHDERITTTSGSRLRRLVAKLAATLRV